MLVLTTSFPRYKGDFAGVFLLDLYAEVAKLGPRFQVIAPHSKDSEDLFVPGLEIERFRYTISGGGGLAYEGGVIKRLFNMRYLPLWPIFMISYTISALKQAKKAAVIHSHWLLSGLVGTVCSKISGRRHVVTVHGSDINYLPERGVIARIARLVLRHSHKVICVSRALEQKVKGIEPRARTVWIPNGINDAFYRKKEETGAPVRFLFIGRLIKEKGLPLLLDLFSNKFSDQQLHICGEGEMLAEVEEAAKRNANITYLGRVPHHEMAAVMEDKHVLLLPSDSEGLPLSVLEAMASSMVVLATPVGGIPEVIEDGRNGILVERQGFGAAVRDLLDNVELRLSIAGAAHQTAKKFNLRGIAERHMGLYRALVGE